jgi:ketosteroid isomerase-like protein
MSKIELYKEEVHRANARFYRAFERLDIHEMEQVWATDEPVKCIHPGWGLLVGWLDVRDSWEAIFLNAGYIECAISHIDIRVEGDIAWVTCQENITQALHGQTIQSKVVATNIFTLRDNRWYLIQHQGSPMVRNPETSI